MRLSAAADAQRLVYTVGHSSRTLGELIALLRGFRVELVVDVRRFPRSRRHPWFNREVLGDALRERGIGYVWLGDLLGGKTVGEYRRYMCSEEYRRGIEVLLGLASERLTAILCAEAYWRKCHRRYIAESLYRRGFRVLHIIDAARVEEHKPLEEHLECV